MGNVFNNYLTSISEKTNQISNFCPNIIQTTYLSNTFFLTPTDKNGTSFYIFTTFPQSSGPNSIPVRILRPQENDITQQLSDIFVFLDWSISFSSENSRTHNYKQKTI